MSKGAPLLIGGGGHFAAGSYRPDRPTGKPIDDVGPKPPPPDERPAKGDPQHPVRQTRTAENLSRVEASLSLRRFSWEADE